MAPVVIRIAHPSDSANCGICRYPELTVVTDKDHATYHVLGDWIVSPGQGALCPACQPPELPPGYWNIAYRAGGTICRGCGAVLERPA